MTREIERLLNHHDNTYAHTTTSLEKRLDAKSDLMMWKLDEILNGSNREERSRQMMETEHAAMPGPSKVREPLMNLSIGNGPGQPHRGQVGQNRSCRRRMPPRKHDCPLCHRSDQCQI